MCAAAERCKLGGSSAAPKANALRRAAAAAGVDLDAPCMTRGGGGLQVPEAAAAALAVLRRAAPEGGGGGKGLSEAPPAVTASLLRDMLGARKYA